MIFTERTITVRKGESTINEPVILYRGDYDVEVRFTIKNSKFIFFSQTNLIESEKAAYAQLAIIKPDGDNVFSDIAKCEEGTVAFVLTSDMIDELHDVGLYSFQIRLYDQDKESRASIPPVEYGIEIREPIASEDHINSVDEALVGYSIAKTTSLDNEPVGPTFDDEGNYNVTDWETGDRITEGKLNKIEDALNSLNQNEQTLDKKIINNYNVLNAQMNNIILGTDETDEHIKAEVQQARSTYATLNDRHNAIENDFYKIINLDGNNCLGFNDVDVSLNDVSLSIRNGVFKLHGTATANTELNILSAQKSPMLEAGPYAFRAEQISGSFSNARNNSIKFYYTSSSRIEVFLNGNTTTATIETQTRAKIYIEQGEVYDNFEFHLWAEPGDVCGEYTPYTEEHNVLRVERRKEDFDRLNAHLIAEDIHMTSEEKSLISNLLNNPDDPDDPDDAADSGNLSIFEDEIADTVNKTYTNMKGQCLSFAWLSDTHMYPDYDENDSSVKQNMDQLHHIKMVNDEVGFDMLVHAGDIVNTQWLWKNATISSEYYERIIYDYTMKLRDTGINDIHVCMGNHDGGFIPNFSGGVGEEFSSYDCFYKNTKQSSLDNKGRVVRDGVYPYYYMDFDNLNLRCIFLSTNIHSTSFDWKGMHYQQVLWLKGVFDEMDADRNVILFTHIPMTRFYEKIINNGSTADGIKILNGFNNHAVVDNTASNSLKSDFTSKNGKILACFSGHYHGDSIIYPDHERAIFSFPEISIGSGGYLANSVITTGDFYDESEAPSRSYNDVSQDLWDSVVYSKTENKIYLTRFGAGEDRVLEL